LVVQHVDVAARTKSGGQFVNFLPAASDDARERLRREVRRWRLHLRPDTILTDQARIFNPIIQG
jgi:RNA-directed DNA polymerase